MRSRPASHPARVANPTAARNGFSPIQSVPIHVQDRGTGEGETGEDERRPRAPRDGRAWLHAPPPNAGDTNASRYRHFSGTYPLHGLCSGNRRPLTGRAGAMAVCRMIQVDISSELTKRMVWRDVFLVNTIKEVWESMVRLWKFCLLVLVLQLATGCASSGKQPGSAALKESTTGSQPAGAVSKDPPSGSQTAGAVSKESVTPASSQGNPTASIDNPVFKFGKEADGEEIVHVFIVKNTGSGVLEIKRVSTD